MHHPSPPPSRYLSYPSHPSDRAVWRAHHCSLLSGEWSGKSIRVESSGLAVETVWAGPTHLYFDAATGKVTGDGVSLWQDQSFTFDLIGAYSANMSIVELLKSHRSGSVTHLAFALDLANQTMTGNFADGSCVLQRTRENGNPPFNGGMMQRSVSNTSTSSLSNVEAPKDLLAFLHLCFPSDVALASKLHHTLLSNEIHEAEQLTTFTSEEWKEVGVALGHRSKIKLQLQRFYPQLMGVGGGQNSNSSGEEALNSQSTVTPDPSSQNSQGINPPYAVHPAANNNNNAWPSQSAPQPSSHYVSAGPGQQMFQSQPQSHFVSQQQLQQQQQSSLSPPSTGPPIEYMCPITHDLMLDPVLCADGFSYDRHAISQWFEQNKTSPITGKIVASKMLTPNVQLRAAIEHFRTTQGFK